MATPTVTTTQGDDLSLSDLRTALQRLESARQAGSFTMMEDGKPKSYGWPELVAAMRKILDGRAPKPSVLIDRLGQFALVRVVRPRVPGAQKRPSAKLELDPAVAAVLRAGLYDGGLTLKEADLLEAVPRT